ncbi:MAG: GAF domain-containing protein, partial [Anaerolineales bacterium]
MHEFLKRHLWWILGLSSLAIILLLATHRSGPMAAGWTAIVIGFGLIAVLANSPIPIATTEIDLSHAISIVLGLTLGPLPALLTLVVGLAVGYFVRSYWDPSTKVRTAAGARLRAWVTAASQQVISLAAGLAAFRAAGGTYLSPGSSLLAVVPGLALGAAFICAFLLLYWITRAVTGTRRPDRTELATLVVLVTGLPIPYAIFTAVAFAALGEPALLIFGGGIAVVAPLVRGMTMSERTLKRKVQELSSLSQVSQKLPVSLDLQQLLSAIYDQVETLLRVDNFYVSLYHPEAQTLSYPLAVKGGTLQQWASRPLSDRLTDRVVLSGEPILISSNAPQTLRAMGLPELNNAPEAWLGVPLVDPDRVIGCLAIFHTRVGQSLSSDDQAILETIAGQTAVAIQNAVLYQQTQSRAQALATLNEITASMSSTLDPDRAMALVCEALIRAGGGRQASIHLIDEERDRMFLASAEGLSDQLIDALRTLPLGDTIRSQAIRANSPVHIPDVGQADLPPALVGLMQHDDIASFTDLPLITPSGVIGLATVYFPTPSTVTSDQLELLETLVAQAALALANARAHAATDQALQRQVDQLSRLETIGREMASTLEPEELFKAILKHSLLAAGAEIGYLAIFESKKSQLKVVASQGYAQEADTSPLPAVFPLEDGQSMERFVTGTAIQLDPKQSASEELPWHSPEAQSVLSAPIIRWGRYIGLISVESPRPYAFGPERERFMAQLAAHAAVAITNASLYQQLEENLLEQSLLYQASVQIANTMEVGSVAMAAADSLAVALSADGASLFRWASDRRELETLAMVVDGRPQRDPQPVVVTEAIAPALIHSVSESTPVDLSPEKAATEADRAYLEDIRHAKSLLAIPLVIGSQPNGLVEIYHRQRVAYDDNQIRTAQTIASQAAIALENTDLFRRIRESQEHILAVLNSTQEGMVMLDESGRVVVANKQLETLTGLPLDQWVGHSIVGPDPLLAERLGYRPGEFEALIRTRPGSTFRAGETSVLEHQAPSRRTLERTVSPVVDETGDLIGWLVVLRDISEAKELSETREQLTEMIVHDLRSPLTTLLGGLKILEDTLTDDQRHSGPAAQALGVSRRSVDQMLGLVNSLLDIAKLESGDLPLSLETVSVSDMLGELVTTYVNEANAESVFLTLNNPSKNGTELQADREKLWRVLINLLDNALKFTPPGGSIDVNLKEASDRIWISVSDTGPGIPEDLREQIFEPFVQVPGVAGRRRGTGLGLAFAKLAVEAHGGR